MSNTKDRIEKPPFMGLSIGSDDLPVAALAELWGAFGSLPGVSVLEIATRPLASQFVEVTVMANCWSPSLHAINGTFTGMVNGSGEPAAIADALLREFQFWTGEQLLRSIEGQKWGLVTPLPTADTIPLETRHLIVDRSIGPLAAAMGEDLVETVMPMIRSMHKGCDYVGGPLLAQGDSSVFSTANGPLIAPEVVIDDTPGRWVVYDGNILRLAGREMPEIAANQAIGHKLKDVADVHPALADRIVDDVNAYKDSQGHPMLGISLVLDIIPFTGIADEIARWSDA